MRVSKQRGRKQHPTVSPYSSLPEAEVHVALVVAFMMMGPEPDTNPSRLYVCSNTGTPWLYPTLTVGAVISSRKTLTNGRTHVQTERIFVCKNA